MSILQNCGQTDTVMESSESQSHLLTNTVLNNSTSLEMNIASIYQKEDVTSKRKEFIAEFSLRRYCSGVMGVPISFLDKFCPEQFEIVGLGNSRDNFTPMKDYINPYKITKQGKKINGGAINCVLTLSAKEKPIGQVYYISDNSDYLIPPYARVLLKIR